MFDIPLPIYVFTKEHALKTLNKSTHIPSLTNNLVSLIELKIQRLITIKLTRVNLKQIK